MTTTPPFRLTQIAYDDRQTPDVRLGYDAVGRRDSMSDASGRSSCAYDLAGQLRQQVDGAGQKVQYQGKRRSRRRKDR